MKKFKKEEIEQALENKRNLEKFLKTASKYKHGELEEFGYDNGCEISNKAGVSLESIITNSYTTHSYGRCHHRKIRVECIDTSIIDMDGNKVYYDVISKKAFVVKIVPADGWDIGWISVRPPRMIDESVLEDYEAWKASCKKYNKEQIRKTSEVFKASEKIVAEFKHSNALSTFELITLTKCVQEMYISNNLLKKFQNGKFTWRNYDNIFQESFGNLPFSVRIIEASLALLEDLGYENNQHILVKEAIQ